MSRLFSLAELSINRPAMRTLFGGLLIAAAAVAVQPSFAHGHGHHRGGGEHGQMMGGGRHADRLLIAVDATDAQRAQIKQIRAAAAADLKPLRETRRSLRERARQLMVAPNAVDRPGAEALRLETMALHDRISKRRLEATLAVAEVLTPQQRTKLGAMMAERGERMKRHHGNPAPKS